MFASVSVRIMTGELTAECLEIKFLSQRELIMTPLPSYNKKQDH